MKQHTTLERLDLRNNRIDQEGARYLGALLAADTALTHVDLSWNDFLVEGGLYLLDGARLNSTLLDLQLSGTKVGLDVLREVAWVVKRNKDAKSHQDRARPSSTSGKVPNDASETEGSGSVSQTSASLPVEGPPNQLRRGLPAPLDDLGSDATVTEEPQEKRESRLEETDDDMSIASRLKNKAETQVWPGDQQLCQHLIDHIAVLQAEKARHEKNCEDALKRERLSTAAFTEREQEFKTQTREREALVQKMLVERDSLQRDSSQKTAMLAQLEEEHGEVIRESAAFQERSKSDDEQLRHELHLLMVQNRRLQDSLEMGQKDLQFLEHEKERLSAHLHCCERDLRGITA